MALITSSILRDFVVLDADKTATLEPADAILYQRLEADYAGFHQCELVSCHEFDKDWTNWEIHPNGDEIVILLSGKLTFLLEKPNATESVTLENAGDFVVVAKNVWHTARTDVPTRALFVTPGENTAHRDI